ncbi:sensor domain-containing protein [Nocardioides rubriscoriae]|uniref:sensor domain-containing protein n=1 Tax=Nocardioides rubriscoriae TaxID=642762 RepID=UPI0011E052D8|nr:sensor domain-containing protein [Nocardioides rubriscoriae]
MDTPLLSTSTSLRRRTTAASTALLLALALAACGGNDDSSAGDDPSSTAAQADGSTTSDAPSTEATDDTSSAAVPTEDELTAVLVTADEVPAGFTQSPADSTDDTNDTFEGTCLGDIGQFSDALGFEPDSEAEVEYTAEGDGGQSAVSSKIEAYADASAVAPAFADFTDTLQQCTSVDTTDKDGVAFSLDIAYDDSVDLPGAEDQLRVDMTGTIASGGQSFDLAYQFVVALSGQFISIVGTYTLGEDTSGVLDSTDDLAALQAGRVADQLG